MANSTIGKALYALCSQYIAASEVRESYGDPSPLLGNHRGRKCVVALKILRAGHAPKIDDSKISSFFCLIIKPLLDLTEPLLLSSLNFSNQTKVHFL